MTKVEPPGEGDALRGWRTLDETGTSYWWRSLARNKRLVAKLLDDLAKRIGFRVADGISERVIFRELFPMGLTMLDLPQPRLEISMSMSHVAARQEVRELMLTLKLPDVGVKAGSV